MVATVDKFVGILLGLIENVKQLCPDNQLLNNNYSLIVSFINANKDLIVRMYCKHCLIYKEQFDANPEAFLLEHDYKEDLKDIPDVPFDQIFVFKKIWRALANEQKETLINFVKGLNKFAVKYLNE